MTDFPEISDPTTAAFWSAAAERRLVVQACAGCGHHQFYPRPFCLACLSTDVDWAEVPGTGFVYSQTVTRLQVLPDIDPPYIVALVQLDEGPRFVTNIVGESTVIGDRVTLDWRERVDGPPLPVFRKA